MPRTSRLGSKLVYRLPGPSTIRVGLEDRLDGLRDAPPACGGLRGRPAESARSRPVIFDSPLTRRPSSMLGAERHVLQRGGQDLAAHRQHAARLAHRLLEVAGDAAHRHDEQVAEAVALQAGALRRSGTGTAASISGSASASATMQLRKSPGGSMPSSRRSRPELPPSSATVTMAVMLVV